MRELMTFHADTGLYNVYSAHTGEVLLTGNTMPFAQLHVLEQAIRHAEVSAYRAGQVDAYEAIRIEVERGLERVA